MARNPDKQFFNLFLLIIGVVIGVTFGLFLVANYMAGKTQNIFVLQDELHPTQVLENIRPVGRAALHGEGIAEPAPVATLEPVAEVRSGPQVYNLACLACHGAGVGGAPTMGDTAAWSPRIAKGDSTLSDHTLNGFTGEAGFMPPKGGRIDLSDQEILAALGYMIEQSR